MIEIKKENFGHYGEGQQGRNRRIEENKGTIQKKLLTYFKGENGKVRPCIENFKVMEMNAVIEVIEIT